jgi:glycosyltransferase involved in cell wall biosynthesis
MTADAKASRKGAVCILRHSSYPAELNVRREAEALFKDGYEVHVVCLREEAQTARETIGGIQVRRLPVRHRRGKIGRYLFEYNAFFLLASIELLRLHFRRRLRAIQVNTMPDYLVFTALIPRLLGVKVVLHLHEPMPELFGTRFPDRRHSWLLAPIRWSERLSLAFADRVLTVTNEMRENVRRRGADASKITVIVNVPDDDLFRAARQASPVGQITTMAQEKSQFGAFRILCHGSIESRYGYDLIVRAVARLAPEIPRIEFRFMGKGSSVPEILALAKELKMEERVTYLGFVPFESMVAEILAADVTVVPMRRNAYSVLVHTNKMFEYMALERPVVASRLNSVVSYFPDTAIAYFEPDDDADLARRLLEIYSSGDAAYERVRAATALYESYRWSHEKRKYLAVYASLLGGSVSSGRAVEARLADSKTAGPAK